MKNASYENAIGFFKAAVGELNAVSNIRSGMIDFYTNDYYTTDTCVIENYAYDINGKFPEDYGEALRRGDVSLFDYKLQPKGY